MTYANTYATFYLGVMPEGEAFNRVNAFFGYLHDAGISEREIHDLMWNTEDIESISFDRIPSSFWEGSLIQKGVFYTHSALRIISKTPTMKNGVIEEMPYSLEMKIRFTIDDLIDYYIEIVRPPASLIDKKRISGGLTYLLEKYSRIEHGTSLDFVLRLIDASKNKHVDPMRLADNEVSVFEQHKRETLNSKGVVVWRTM